MIYFILLFTCPVALNVNVVNSTRMCIRSHTDGVCSSFTFPTFDVPYSKVCGRARGYLYRSPDGFRKYTSFEGYPDVEGLIITHGSPRNTFGPLPQECLKTTTIVQPVPVLPLILASIHLQLSEKTTSASLGTVGHLNADGTLPIGAYTLHLAL